MARILGLDAIPEGLWPAMGDPRVDIAIPMSSEGYFFNEDGLAEITIPMLIMGGTGDTGVSYDWGVRPVYDYASSQQKALVTFEAADHFILAPDCEDAPTTVDLLGNDFYYLCSDPVWDLDRAHDLVNHFVVAFLLDQLKGDAEAAAALAPDAVSFPGITYEAQGF
jgi:predicted dienelactone hydrolase